MKTLLFILTAASILLLSGCYIDEPELTPTPPPTVTPEPAIFWATIYGGTGNEKAFAVQETSDNGYYVFGDSTSFAARSYDFFVLKLDSLGNLSWSKTFGGGEDDYGYYGVETSDSGFIIAGRTYSFGAGDSDAWIIKMMGNGVISWQTRFHGGTTGHDYFNEIIETSGHNYIAAGTWAPDSNSRNILVMKFAENGDIIWEKGFGGTGTETACSLDSTTDNGFIISGYTNSFGQGNYDGLVIKVDSIGNLQWQKVIGSTGAEYIMSIKHTSDEGYIMAGYYDPDETTIYDLWVIKMDTDGDVEWQYTYGGDGSEWAESVLQTEDGGYIVCGNTNSTGNGDYDVLVLKLAGNGDIEWQKTYGSTGYDRSRNIKTTSDGGYILTGNTQSYGAGESDIWVIKLNESGECTPLDTDSSLTRTFVSPGIISPANVVITTDLGSADTTCIVEDAPEVTVTQLIP
jgi:hypothetical protein